MKSLLILFLSASFVSFAQLTTPPLSPKSTLNQQVGLTDFSIEYSRPGVRGRAIFGSLVPYDKLWRLGANENTKISFSDDLTFGTHVVKAGTYAMFLKPNKKEWTIYLYSEVNNWGLPQEWEESKVAATLSAKVEECKFKETLTIDLNSFHNEGGSLEVAWENSRVTIPFSIDTKKKVISSIEKTMAGPSGNDYYKASKYYLQENLDANQALEWAEKACEMRPEAYWIVRNKALILAKLEKYELAIQAAELSTKLAKKEGDESYVVENENSIVAWKKLMNK